MDTKSEKLSNKKADLCIIRKKIPTQTFLLLLYFYALERYSLVRVSTLILSPIFTNNGTCITTHVVRVAGFFPPVAVSPFSHGGVSMTSSTTLDSRLILIGLPLNSCNITLSPSTKKSISFPIASFVKETCSYVS